MKGLKYIAPFTNVSGYGEASRNYILALHKAGVPLTIQSRSFEVNPPLVGTEEERDILASLHKKQIDYDTIIVHMTPDLAPEYKNFYAGKKVISSTVWETSHIHPHWVDCCNYMDGVFLPCQWNVNGFKESGVKVPIHKVPHCVSPNYFEGIDETGIEVPDLDRNKTFIFYSIFQWSYRKNPDALLRSYFAAFGPDDNVVLILKTYVGAGKTPTEEASQIKEVINRIKGDLGFPHYPKIRLITDQLPSEQLKSLHKFGHCYTIFPRGEGWALSNFEAGLAGTPVISTGMGGQMEFMTAENSYPIDFMETYVSGMGNFNRWYLGSQKWAEPSVIDAALKMREVYNNYPAAKEKALLLQQNIKDNFNEEKIASTMIKAIEEI